MIAATERPTILIVDDEETNIDILLHTLDARYDVSVATNGYEALELVRTTPPDMILLDIVMPGLDGFQVCQQLKSDPLTHEIPVVFITARTQREDVLRGLSLGALHYITKPFDRDMLLAIVASVASDHHTHRIMSEELRHNRGTLAMLEEGRFRFRTLEEARNLAMILVRMSPIDESCLMGITELMVNAVEHGNLGITYREKSRLNKEGKWQTEVKRRLDLPEFANRYATVGVSRGPNQVRFLIRDQGNGFDWHPYLEFSPERAFDSHGRGIAMACITGFSQVSYQGIGNEVLAIANTVNDD